MNTEEEIAARVAAVLTGGELRVGATVRSLSGKEAVVIRLRPGGSLGGKNWQWVRVRFIETGGHWEYGSRDLTVIT